MCIHSVQNTSQTVQVLTPTVNGYRVTVDPLDCPQSVWALIYNIQCSLLYVHVYTVINGPIADIQQLLLFTLETCGYWYSKEYMTHMYYVLLVQRSARINHSIRFSQVNSVYSGDIQACTFLVYMYYVCACQWVRGEYLLYFKCPILIWSPCMWYNIISHVPTGSLRMAGADYHSMRSSLSKSLLSWPIVLLLEILQRKY